MTDEEMSVVDAMSSHGGSFVAQLANAFRHADANNFQKLKNAFPEYWETYAKMAEKKK